MFLSNWLLQPLASLLQDQTVSLKLAASAFGPTPSGSDCSLWNWLVFGLQAVWVFALEKSLWKMVSQLSKYFQGTSPTETLANFMFKNCGASSCTFLTKWTGLTNSNFSGHYGELLKSPNLLLLKPNWTTIALKLAKLNGLHISIGIPRLWNVTTNSKLPLCKIKCIN